MAQRYSIRPIEYALGIRVPAGVELHPELFLWDYACFRAHNEVLEDEAKQHERGG